MSERQNSVTAIRPGIDSPGRERQSGIKIHRNYKSNLIQCSQPHSKKEYDDQTKKEKIISADL